MRHGVEGQQPQISGLGSARALRPWYLVAAMVLVWLFAVRILIDRGSLALVLREGAVPGLDELARTVSTPLATNLVVERTLDHARLAVLGAASGLVFPVSVARALLAAGLVLAATLVLAGRPSARTFALQMLGANAVVAVAEYAIFRDLRAQWIDAAVTSLQVLPGIEAYGDMRQYLYFIERAVLVLVQVGVPLAGAIALTRPRTRTYFAEVAAAAESTEEP